MTAQVIPLSNASAKVRAETLKAKWSARVRQAYHKLARERLEVLREAREAMPWLADDPRNYRERQAAFVKNAALVCIAACCAYLALVIG
jgi:hypothetical protein